MNSILRGGLLLACLSASAAAEPGGTAAVNIDNFTFGPARLTVSRGSEVTWTNDDDIPHTVVMTTANVRSKTIDTGQTFTYRFDKTGTYAYICGLHPHMHGQVVVQ